MMTSPFGTYLSLKRCPKTFSQMFIESSDVFRAAFLPLRPAGNLLCDYRPAFLSDAIDVED